MILTKEFLNQVLQLFDDTTTENQQLINQDITLEGNLYHKDDKIIITLTKKENADKVALNDFISKISEADWSYVVDNFQDITGQPLDLVNQLYEQGQYSKVKQLIILVISNKINDLTKLIS